MTGRILIAGAGPAGLGAAWRLQELGYPDWLLLEGAGHPGGLAASFVDARGFTWDIGGHVVFSHCAYFDAVLDSLFAPGEWTFHEREAWIHMRGRLLPYPFQHNLWRLPKAEVADCLAGLIEARLRPAAAPRDFAAYLLARFGAGLCRSFLFAYNGKVWGYPPARLGCDWVKERVAEIDLERVVRNTILERDDPDWGPNRSLRYPLRGGTGGLWTRCAERLPQERLRFNAPVGAIDSGARLVRTRDGVEHRYDALISTVPLPALCGLAGLPGLGEQNLLSTVTHAIGIGLAGAPPPELPRANWIYFPEPDCPFYRVTLLSNYSPHVVPDPSRHWSLLCEVSESKLQPVDAGRLVSATVKGLVATGMIRSSADVISTWHHRAAPGYPVPSCGRDAVLDRITPVLEARGIYSRGRHGAWKYEVGNQDHSFMQGVEAVDRILLGKPESVLDGTRVR